MGKNYINQGVPRVEDLKEETYYADNAIVDKKLGPSDDKSEGNVYAENAGVDTTYSSLSYEVEPPSEDDEDTYSVLTYQEV